MLNYRHLHYFWVVAKAGGFARAAEQLDMAIQTITVQVRELERALGHQLLKPAGRGVALTEAGQAALATAETIFQLGQALPENVQQAASGKVTRLAVGLSDGLSKLAAHQLLEPLLGGDALHLVCHDGEVDELLAELALHRLDLVLAGQPAPRNPNLRLSSQRIAESPVEWYGPVRLVRRQARSTFPQVLADLPVLLPTGHSPLRAALDQWFDALGLHPNVVGEFEDSALMAVFAARGMGVCPVSALGVGDASPLRGLHRLGEAQGVREEIHAIRSRRGQHHPVVNQLIERALEQAGAGSLGGARPGRAR